MSINSQPSASIETPSLLFFPSLSACQASPSWQYISAGCSIWWLKWLLLQVYGCSPVCPHVIRKVIDYSIDWVTRHIRLQCFPLFHINDLIEEELKRVMFICSACDTLEWLQGEWVSERENGGEKKRQKEKKKKGVPECLISLIRGANTGCACWGIH